MPLDDGHDFHNWHISLLQLDWALLTPAWWRFSLQGSHWRLYFHDRDGAMLEIAGDKQPLRAGRLYLIPADRQLAASTEAVVGQLYCHFHLLGLPAFTQRVLFDSLIEAPVSAGTDELAAAITTQVRAGLPVDMALECRVKALIYTAIGLTIEGLPAERIARSQHMHANLQPVLAAMEYIDEHLDERISLAMLADACALTPVYFGRRFHHCTGMTPINYLQEARVKAAMQQLAFTDHSIEEIAQHTGFGSRAYFSRIFLRHSGQSPAAYRKALRT